MHHVKPFHLDPALELDPGNLIALCMKRDSWCHLYLGHGDDFRAYNAKVRDDAVEASKAFEKGDREAVKAVWARAKRERLTE